MWFMATLQTSCISGNQFSTAPASVRHLTSWLFGENAREARLVLALLALWLAMCRSWTWIKEGTECAYLCQLPYSPSWPAYVWTPSLGWRCPIFLRNPGQWSPVPSCCSVWRADSTKDQGSGGEVQQTWAVTCTACKGTMQLALSDREQRWTYGWEEKLLWTSVHNSHTTKHLQKWCPTFVTLELSVTRLGHSRSDVLANADPLQLQGIWWYTWATTKGWDVSQGEGGSHLEDEEIGEETTRFLRGQEDQDAKHRS